MDTLEEKFVNDLEKYIMGSLAGEKEEFDFIEDFRKPENDIIIGTLASFNPDEIQSSTKTRTNSISIRFLTRELSEIIIDLSSAIYFFSFPSLEELKKKIVVKLNKNLEEISNEDIDIFELEEFIEKHKKICFKPGWRKERFQIPTYKVDLKYPKETEIKLTDVIEYVKNHPLSTGTGSFADRNKPIEISSSSLISEDKYAEELAILYNKLPNINWRISILVEVEDYDVKEQIKQVIITISNITDEDKKYDNVLFNVKPTIKLGEVKILPYHFSYDYENYQKSYSSDIQSLNCFAYFDKKSNLILTKNYSRFEQPKILPKTDVISLSKEELELTFQKLANDEKNISLLEKFSLWGKEYLEMYRNEEAYSMNKEFTDYTNRFAIHLERMEEGIKLLKDDKTVRKAFELMNETFHQASKGNYDRWRVFQLFFVLMLLPDIVNKNSRRNIAEVLHVQTGGGKSEAYFACVVFSSFLDRLNGKRSGLTAITKFPLRMLSIQQLQRIAQIMIFAEEVRIVENVPGEPFTVGYFVGNSEEFPAYNYYISKEIEKKVKQNKKITGKIINECPICDDHKEVVLTFKNKENLIYHKCTNCNREYGLFYVDCEIYRVLPTFIVSTVDKHAAVALNRRYKNFLGGKLDVCPKGHLYFPHGDRCNCAVGESKYGNEERCGMNGAPLEIDYSMAPSIIIQDEMHLIREGFGTIDSHFETLFEEIQNELSGYKPKNIAMTATISGAKSQIKQLYNKDTNVFPIKSPFGQGTKDFFFNLEKKDNEVQIQRVIFGLRPNYRDNQFACLLTLKYIAQFILELEKSKDEFAKKYGGTIDDINSILTLYKSILTYHNKRSDVNSMNYFLQTVVNSNFEDKGGVIGLPLTGDNTLDEIRSHINKVETYDYLNDEKILSTFATNIVSHGVDIDIWNIMMFQGIPRSTAEYIQALSRVGRKHLGLVFLWFYGTRVRDISFYHNFMNYHEIIDHHIDVVPIARWAKLGVYQTFTSIFCASILNYLSDKYNQPLYKVEQVNNLLANEEVKEELITIILRAYGVSDEIVDSKFLYEYVPKEVEQRLKFLREYRGESRNLNFFPNALRTSGDFYYQTQFGMRGIQDEVILQPVYYETDFVKRFLKGENDE